MLYFGSSNHLAVQNQNVSYWCKMRLVSFFFNFFFLFPLVCSGSPDIIFFLGLPGLGGVALLKYLHRMCLLFPSLVRMEQAQCVMDSK